MVHINPHLHCNGIAEEVFAFIKNFKDIENE
jgi:hypothetical protein